MSRTKRTQNKCKTCSYTWYPRGKNLSHKCSKCGSEDVGYAKGGLILGAVIIVSIALFGGPKSREASEEPVAEVAPVAGELANRPEPSPVSQPVTMPSQPPDERNMHLQEREEPSEGRTETPSTTSAAEQQVKPVSNELY